jgi:hypothetical protein
VGSVEESTRPMLMSKRQATTFVVMRRKAQEEEEESYHHVHQASFVPTIVFISCALAMLLVIRCGATFAAGAAS